MSTKLISLEAAGNASLVVPSTMPDAVLTGIIPLVVPAIQAITATGGQIVKVIAKEWTETSAQIAFYDAVGREIEERVIPVLAPIEAVQQGLNHINKGHLDPRLRNIAEKKLLGLLD